MILFILQAHYALMDKNGIKINSMDRAAYQMLVPEYAQMKNYLDLLDSTKEEDMGRWSAKLEEDIKIFHESVKHMTESAKDERLLEDVEFIDPVMTIVQNLKDECSKLEATAKDNQKFQALFGQQLERYPELDELVSEVNLKSQMWEARRDLFSLTETWKDCLVMEMPLKEWEAQCTKWYKTATRAERELPTNNLVPKLKEVSTIWKNLVPACGDLKNPNLQERHWEKLEGLVGFKFERDPETWSTPFTLGSLLQKNIMQYKDDIQRISTEATQESVLEEMLGKVKASWAEAEFQLTNFKDQKDVYILVGVDDVQALLDESMMTIGTILASRYVAGIRPEVEKMETALKSLQAVLDEWLGVQKNWMYLEPIFSAPDIQRQLPAEAKMFADVDKGLKAFIKKVSENPNCMRIGMLPSQADIFSSWNMTLETTQKQLEAYLEFKCMAFPRFYFLSNDELLEILAQTRNVQAVQPHMNKCFDGIKGLDFGGQHPNSPIKKIDENSVDIYGIISPESEYVTMGKNLKARGEVENWLMATEKRMVESLRQLSKDSVVDYTTRPRHEWVLDHAGQIIILTSQIYWAKGAEEALDGLLVPDNPIEGIKQWYDQTVEYLGGLISLVRGELTKLQRGSLVALITIDVHNRDIIEYLVNDKTDSKKDFNWQMRIRYYWDDSIGAIGDCRIQQVTAEFVFAHEYLGASFRLVITPLSDRCYMTLTGALQLQLGGAPAGPAGTGKTETTKDLAKALGNCCVVFNCGDNLDYKFMGKFLKGLAQCGAWACFDEFNRINVEVLSVVAQQIITIQIALRAKATEFEFEGQMIKLILTFGVFITMNPGYAGRTELPDNLKALFRPMSMMVPDYALIAEISLFAEGFETAKILSKKMAKLYKLASEQVSAQPHYDFGMRAIKSVLVMAGTGKRNNPDMSETIVMIRAMCDSNIPKFLDDDVILFNAIVQDLFPGVEVPKQDTGALVVSIRECLDAADLRLNDAWCTKCVQLYEVLGIRFGVMQVGPSGGGKTCMARCIAEAMGKLREQGSPDVEHQVTHTYCLNPKSISMGELYGNYNLLTNEWTDGLGSTIIRNANGDTTDDKKFVVFDGPIDAIWIENMNTVLDDNRTLCLPNGERIKLNGKTMRMLFEVEECSQASPATVSRLGVVWLPPDSIGLRFPVETWMCKYAPEGMSQELKDKFMELYDTTMEASIKFVRRNCRELIPSMDNNLVMSCCRLFQSLFQESKGAKLDAEDIMQTMTKMYMWSLVWSVGGNVDGVEGKEKFSEFIRENFSNILRFPNSNTVYDYVLDPESKEFQAWEEITRPFVYDKNLKFSDILVPTKDTCRYSYVLGTCVEVQRNCALIGDTGTGKSVIVADALNYYMESLSLVTLTMNFSAQTGAKQLQEAMELKFEKRRKGIVGSPIGKLLVCFIDDVNMPTRETYGAQPPIEVLRLMQDRVEYYRPYGGVWDRKKLLWSDLVDTVLCSACGPPGGGRNIVTNRYFRFFTMLNISAPSQSVLKVIFGSILEGHLSEFPNDVKMLSKQTVDSSIDIYERISTEMLPTPAKSHYTFNLRDLSKVFQGVLSLKVQHCPNATVYCRLWTHECQRVFADRLIDTVDKAKFNEWLHEFLKRKFNMDWDYEETFVRKPILFGDYLKMGVTGDDRMYEPIQDNSKLAKLMDAYLEDYNASSPKGMNLVFFMDAIEHISRLARIIRSPRGNAMLVGLGGSGKQSLTRLSAFMAEFKCFQIELSKGYSNNEFREDLKKIFITAGVDRQTIVFLFTDGQIVNEGFVEDINSILNAGDVPNLFPPDEKDRIIGDCREYTASLGKPLTKDSVYSTFVSCVQANLHCVLCMSPVGEAFRRRCRMFPSLINCCTIDWYLPWPQEALADVADRFMAQVENVSDEHKVILAKMCPIIHGSIEKWSDTFFDELRRKFYISPKSYLDMIALYTDLLKIKRLDLSTAKDRFVNGLNKMEEVGIVIESAKQDLAVLEPVLKEKSAATEVLLKQVAIDKEEAAKVEVVVSKDAAEVEEFAAGVKVIQEDAQRDLDEALPALNAAVSALNSLTKGDITEVKSFAKPPPLVQTTMEAVCILVGRKPDWDNSKKLLGESDFMEQLINFDKDNIDPGRIKKLQKYVLMEDFTAEAVGKVSRAAKGLCMWARAMDVYARVAKEVEPKKAKLAEANSQLDAAMKTLNEKKANLKEVQDKVAALEAQLSAAQAEQKNLADQADLCQARLDRSGKLTSALGDEQVNWTNESANLSVLLEQLVGNVFLGAACVAYIGPFTGVYRKQVLVQWVETAKEMGLPTSDVFDLPGTLAKPVDVRTWNIQGLPSDEVSIANGVLVKNTTRWPLMIDPEMQANKWVKQMEEQNGLRLIKLSDGKYLQTLEACVRNGNPLLLEDVGEELDPALEPILMKQLFKQGGRLLIRLGENDIDYDENFRFYMTTKLPNPHYLPDVCIKSTIINFMITMDGLEDQLLGDVVRQERPDLEEKKDKLVVSMANDKKQLGDLQDKVLKLLQEAEGMILDNEPLINTLQQSKVTSGMINKRVAEAEEANVSIAEAREGYRTAATRGALLYFVIADLPNMDPMYQYSLEYFKKLYNYCIEVSDKSEDLETRLLTIMDYVTKFMYLNVCRGLFSRHKLIFSFLIYSSIFRNKKEISAPEWNNLLRGGFGKPPKNPDSAFMTQLQWEALAGVEEAMPGTFPDLCDHITNKIKEWKSWASTDVPHTAPMPSPWNTSLNSFQKMCILKIFRREKLVFATENIVAENLGKSFTESPPIVLAEIFPDTGPTTPIIFVLSTGSDPTGALIKFAEDRGILNKFQSISLGQGQGPVAEKLVAASTKVGNWVCLMNCHLATSWMSAMEKLIDNFSVSPPEDPNFRLWLTSQPSTAFPVSVLQNGIKLTNEPPKGMRANLIGTFTTLGEEEWECMENEDRNVRYWKKMLVALAFFHGITQERRKYGPLGWNIRYEFNTSDVLCAKDVLKMFVRNFEEMPWAAITYITGHVNYGGRVTDDQDRRCLMNILKTYYPGEEVVQDDSYKFSESGTYYSPPVGSFKAVMEYFDNLPMVDNPEVIARLPHLTCVQSYLLSPQSEHSNLIITTFQVFGMHDNANIAFQLQETTNLYDAVLSLQPKVGGGGGGEGEKTTEEIVDEFASDLEEKVSLFFTHADSKLF
jgi:dynein heavy chain